MSGGLLTEKLRNLNPFLFRWEHEIGTQFWPIPPNSWGSTVDARANSTLFLTEIEELPTQNSLTPTLVFFFSLLRLVPSPTFEFSTNKILSVVFYKPQWAIDPPWLLLVLLQKGTNCAGIRGKFPQIARSKRIFIGIELEPFTPFTVKLGTILVVLNFSAICSLHGRISKIY